MAALNAENAKDAENGGIRPTAREGGRSPPVAVSLSACSASSALDEVAVSSAANVVAFRG
jgi:hypothetical protein